MNASLLMRDIVKHYTIFSACAFRMQSSAVIKTLSIYITQISDNQKEGEQESKVIEVNMQFWNVHFPLIIYATLNIYTLKHKISNKV